MSDTTTAPETVTEPQGGAKTYSEDYVKELRSEAARYRNEKKSAVDAATAALSTEWESKLQGQQTETTRVTAELGDSWVELEKLYSSIEAGVPTDKLRDFVGVLKGTDKDSISESVKSAIALFGGFGGSTPPPKQPAIDPTQGSGGNPLALNGNPILDALKRAVGAP